MVEECLGHGLLKILYLYSELGKDTGPQHLVTFLSGSEPTAGRQSPSSLF